MSCEWSALGYTCGLGGTPGEFTWGYAWGYIWDTPGDTEGKVGDTYGR